jgi:hypothetical protein
MPAVGAEVVGYRGYRGVVKTAPLSSWTLYTYTLKLDYREFDSNSRVLDRDYSQWGELNGVGIRYSDPLFYFFGEVARGQDHYEGATWDGQPLSNTQRGVYIWNVEGGIKDSAHGLAVGVGYRVWNRGNSGTEGDYDEVYYWPYFALSYYYPIETPQFSFTPSLSYQYAISPKMRAYLGDSPTFDLGRVTGLRIELPFYYRFNPTSGVYFGYRFQLWEISGSGATPVTIGGQTYTLYEPPSKTIVQSLQLGIMVRF